MIIPLKERTKKQFMDMMKGIWPSSVAHAMNEVTPGIHWHGSTKGMMALHWCGQDHFYVGGTSYVEAIDLDILKERAIYNFEHRRKRGLREW